MPESPWVETSATTDSAPLDPPLPPEAFTATVLSTTSIQLDWVRGTGGGLETETSVFVATGGPAGFAPVVTGLAPGTFTYTHTGLTPSTTYWYKLIVYNNDGYAQSEVVSATTESIPAPIGTLPVPLYAPWKDATMVLPTKTYSGTGDVKDLMGNGHDGTNTSVTFKDHNGTNYIWHPTGDGLDRVTTSITGTASPTSQEIIACARKANWTDTQDSILGSNGADTVLRVSGVARIGVRLDHVTAGTSTILSTVAMSLYTDGEWHWVRALVTWNGGGNVVVDFYESADPMDTVLESVSWTAVGTQVDSGVASSDPLVAARSALVIGQRVSGTVAEDWDGDIAAVSYAENGTVLARLVPSDIDPSDQDEIVDSTPGGANTWTVSRSTSGYTTWLVCEPWILLDGSAGYTEIDHHADLNADNDFTALVVTQAHNSPAATARVFTKTAGGDATDEGWSVVNDTTDDVLVELSNGTTEVTDTITDGSLPLSDKLVQGFRLNTVTDELEAYAGGLSGSPTSTTHTESSTDAVRIGSESDGGAGWAGGYTLAAIWNQALTDSELAIAEQTARSFGLLPPTLATADSVWAASLYDPDYPHRLLDYPGSWDAIVYDVLSCLDLPGGTDYATVPDSTAINALTDMTLIVKSRPTDWSTISSTAYFLQKASHFGLYINTVGNLFMQVHDGTWTNWQSTAKPLTVFDDGVAGWLKAVYDHSAGTVDFSYSLEATNDWEAVSWTALGTQVSNTPLGTLTTSGTALGMGATGTGSSPMTGDLHRVVVLDGNDEAVVDVDYTALPAPSTGSPTFTALTGQTVTINGNADIAADDPTPSGDSKSFAYADVPYFYFAPSTVTSWLDTPHAHHLEVLDETITGWLDIQLCVDLPSWTPHEDIVLFDDPGTGVRQLLLTTEGKLKWTYSTATGTSVNTSTNSVSFTSGVGWVRVASYPPPGFGGVMAFYEGGSDVTEPAWGLLDGAMATLTEAPDYASLGTWAVGPATDLNTATSEGLRVPAKLYRFKVISNGYTVIDLNPANPPDEDSPLVVYQRTPIGELHEKKLVLVSTQGIIMDDHTRITTALSTTQPVVDTGFNTIVMSFRFDQAPDASTTILTKGDLTVDLEPDGMSVTYNSQTSDTFVVWPNELNVLILEFENVSGSVTGVRAIVNNVELLDTTLATGPSESASSFVVEEDSEIEFYTLAYFDGALTPTEAATLAIEMGVVDIGKTYTDAYVGLY
jgi:hypothetical protein